MTSVKLDERDVAVIQDVIANVALASIDYYELGASRLDAEEAEVGADDNLTISIQYRGDEETGFAVRLLAEAVLPNGRVRACVAGEYRFNDGYVADHRACQLFVNEVGVMTVFPYLREAVATTSARVFAQPIHLPMIERGELRLDIPDRDEA